MKLFAKVMDVLATVITVVVILAAGLLFVPRIFGYTPYIVMSGSMEPVIETGSVVYINENDRDVEVDDIVAFREGNDVIVTHRIVGIDSTTGNYYTKGDNNENMDLSTVSQEQIEGTYSRHIPKLGYPLARFESKTFKVGSAEIPAGLTLVIMLLLLVNGLAAFLEKMAEDEEDEKEIDREIDEDEEDYPNEEPDEDYDDWIVDEEDDSGEEEDEYEDEE